MKTPVRFLVGLAVALGLQCSAQAFCGFYAGKADASLFNQASQVVLVRDGDRTVLSMQNDYQGPLNEFALIVPTPVSLKQGQVRIADTKVFQRLDEYSSPRLAEYFDRDPCQVDLRWGQRIDQTLERMPLPAPMAMANMAGAARAKELGVTVESSYTLEEYDIVTLSATQSDGLETWLRENGYSVPKGASAALKPYINQGMKFFVAKVNLDNQKKTGYVNLRPLQFAFESDKFMLPMRLGMLNAPPDKAQDLIVYVLTKKGRVESSNYRTVQLPANLNIPYFVKPKFQDFYKALFDKAAHDQNNKVVFTEYFWNMGWCDPCAGQPLSHDELRAAGVFWIDGNPEDTFKVMTAAPGATVKSQIQPPPLNRFGGQPVQLTRLHVRYTPATFPEDLMMAQTADTQNWQTRYVIQNPVEGTPEQCDAKLAEMGCANLCKPRVADVLNRPVAANEQSALMREKDPIALTRDCVSACVSAKSSALEAALQYYQSDLPQRIAAEKNTLARLTGWSISDINAMPNAAQYVSSNVAPRQVESETWWQRLFNQGPSRN
jgi:hypothetical protein